MTTLTITIDRDELDNIIADELRRCYTDAVRHWHNEPDHERLTEALLTVIEHYMTNERFEGWYETIKEL